MLLLLFGLILNGDMTGFGIQSLEHVGKLSANETVDRLAESVNRIECHVN